MSKCLACGHTENTNVDGVDCPDCGGMVVALND